MYFKRKLTDVAVDSFKDYLQDKFEKLKQLDLDGDGQKDVEQIKDLLLHLSATVKETVESTDFPKLASGIEQIISGATMIGASVDRNKLGNTCSELGAGLIQIGRLLELGVKEMKKEEREGL